MRRIDKAIAVVAAAQALTEVGTTYILYNIYLGVTLVVLNLGFYVHLN